MVAINADFFYTILVNSMWSYVQILLAVLYFPKNKGYTYFYFFSILMMILGPIYSVERLRFGPDYGMKRIVKVLIYLIISSVYYSLGIYYVLKQKNLIINLIVKS